MAVIAPAWANARRLRAREPLEFGDEPKGAAGADRLAMPFDDPAPLLDGPRVDDGPLRHGTAVLDPPPSVLPVLPKDTSPAAIHL